jgi:DNA repair exonuclease SbcCD ATPase subunit
LALIKTSETTTSPLPLVKLVCEVISAQLEPNYITYIFIVDIRKRMQDLKDQEEKQASTRNEERIKEREQQKIIEELRTEKVRRSELEDKSEDLSRKLEVLERGFNEASSRRKDLERDLDAVVRENRMLKQELDQEKGIEVTRTFNAVLIVVFRSPKRIRDSQDEAGDGYCGNRARS